jgi:hypothetical protein
MLRDIWLQARSQDSELKQHDPQTLAPVITILQKNPEFEKLWQPRLVQYNRTQQEQFLFMLAARWSDDIRRNKRYNRSQWHYINLGYKPDDEIDTIALKKTDSENILVAFSDNLNILKSNASDTEKAIALCWILLLKLDPARESRQLDIKTF